LMHLKIIWRQRYAIWKITQIASIQSWLGLGLLMHCRFRNGISTCGNFFTGMRHDNKPGAFSELPMAACLPRFCKPMMQQHGNDVIR
ncbi:MAG: hypothetical protein ABFC94_09555, partial [Syntrophomonas sp.]